jgi:hypothetical protein
MAAPPRASRLRVAVRGHEVGMASIVGGLVLCLGAVIAAALTGGCSFSRDCTEAGCDDGVALEAPVFEAGRDEWLTLRACVEDKCAEKKAEFSRFGVEVDVPEDRDEVSVRFTVRDDRGRVLLDAEGTGRVEINRPNGASCPPECRFVRVRLAAGRLAPVAS